MCVRLYILAYISVQDKFACIVTERVIVVFYKLRNKNKTIVNHKGKQPWIARQVNVAKDICSDKEHFIVSYNDNNPSEDWIFYSGCKLRMCPNQDFFSINETESKYQLKLSPRVMFWWAMILPLKL